LFLRKNVYLQICFSFISLNPIRENIFHMAFPPNISNILFKVAAFLHFVIIFAATTSSGEELEPRQWSHLPVNTNFVGAGYAYTEADIDFDPVLKIENAEMEMNTWAAKYTRSFALLKKMARIDILLPYQEGRWTGLLDGAPTTVKRSGFSDINLRFAINLYGSPPLQGKEYAAYRAEQEIETIIGVGLSVQLPTGAYLSDKLINLGTNRYTFRPQFGVIHKKGNWSLETTGLVALYTDNSEFVSNNKLEQEPLYIIHSHLIYTFPTGVWASASGGYDYGGRSTVAGIKKDDRRQNLAWALSFGLPVSRKMGIKISYIGIRTQESIGTDSDTFLAGLSAFW